MDKYTKFLDKDYLLGDSLSLSLSLVGELENAKSLKLAIQAHIYYADMIAEFIAYLKDSPFEFDLLISVNSSEKQGICEQKFTRKTLPRLKNLLVKITPNVGRDVAPFLIAFKDELARYDLVCHIHTKKTPHDEELSGWADYLLRNLISREAMANIIAHFASDEGLGMVFPPAYVKLFDGNSLALLDIDKTNMQALLDRLKIDLVPNESNFIFSPGTMFWARPEALKSLFELGISYDEFPREPIGTSGTLAHAIERVFGIVAEHSGYKVRFYIIKQDLVAPFFKARFYEHKFNEAFHSWQCLFHLSLFSVSIKEDRYIRFRILGLPYSVKKHKFAKISKFLPRKIKKFLRLES